MEMLNNYLDPIAKVWGYVKPSYLVAIRKKGGVKTPNKKVRNKVTKKA